MYAIIFLCMLYTNYVFIHIIYIISIITTTKCSHINNLILAIAEAALISKVVMSRLILLFNGQLTFSSNSMTMWNYIIWLDWLKIIPNLSLTASFTPKIKANKNNLNLLYKEKPGYQQNVAVQMSYWILRRNFLKKRYLL